MKNSKLVEEAKLNPGRIYQRPHDVLRDRRLDDVSRLEILHAWGARLRDPGSPQETGAAAQIAEIGAAVQEVEQRLPVGRAAE
jgi:hypothetical protein